MTAESTSASQTSSDKSDEINGAAAAPDRVTVYRPGVVDTSLTVDDVPVWPGPDPSEFLKPTLPSGESGELTGEEAEAVYEAALDYLGAIRVPGELPNLGGSVALWNVGGTLEWLVVDPHR